MAANLGFLGSRHFRHELLPGGFLTGSQLILFGLPLSQRLLDESIPLSCILQFTGDQ